MTTQFYALMALAQKVTDRTRAFERFPDRDRREAMRKAEENFAAALRALIEERDRLRELATIALDTTVNHGTPLLGHESAWESDIATLLKETLK